MSKSAGARRGPEAFETFYQSLYESRWPSLRASLGDAPIKILRRNNFLSGGRGDGDLGRWPEGETPVPSRGPEGLLEFYAMDPASVEAAKALEVHPGDRVLDMCAAPGGKTLILAEALKDQGELVANEFSASRRERLIKVIQNYVPRTVRDRVFVTGQDGARLAMKEPEAFDRILVDAPCSGERHLLANPSELQEWSIRRSENLATRQYALLAGAWIALRPGGRIVYSTCSLSRSENDEVVDRLVRKKGAELLSLDLRAGAERTNCGQIFLPDREGWGPLYFAVLTKPSS